jgi:voltage-gated potassium channel
MDATTTMTTSDGSTAPPAVERPGAHESSMYELFIGVLTVMSLSVMALQLLVRNQYVDGILIGVDTLFCFIFLADFVRSVRYAPNLRVYLFGERPGRTLPTGVLDLVSSIPAAGPLRAFRIFRLARVARIVRAKGGKSLAHEFIARRAESAIYLIVIMTMTVLTVGGCLIALVEPPAEGSNIKDGGDAFWWAFVTITTVGYGDRFPVTPMGRVIGMATMAVGIGIFGVLTSYLSATFMAPPKPPPGTPPEPTMRDLADELAAVRQQLADLTATSQRT